MTICTATAGPPIGFAFAVDTNGRELDFRSAIFRLQLSNTGANPVRIYFSQTDFDDDANFKEIDASTGWFDGPTRVVRIWLRAVGGDTAVDGIGYAEA